MRHNRYNVGEYNVICDVCGVKCKNVDLVERWDGFWMHPEESNPRHPLDFIRAYQREPVLPWSRPEPADQFVTVVYISVPDSNNGPFGDGG